MTSKPADETLLVECYAETVLAELPGMVAKRCFGCSQTDENGEEIFFGSQLDHDVCTMMDSIQQIDLLTDDILWKIEADPGLEASVRERFWSKSSSTKTGLKNIAEWSHRHSSEIATLAKRLLAY